jgi:hypothetical protein
VGDRDVEPLVAKRRRQEIGDALFVVHDQDSRLLAWVLLQRVAAM